MMSILVLSVWIAVGVVGAMRFGPAGSWPVALILGPLWLPVAAELRRTTPSSEHEVQQRLEHLGFLSPGDQ